MTTARMGIYSVCVVNPELQTERVTGVTIEADSLAGAYRVWNELPGHMDVTSCPTRHIIMRTVRESYLDKFKFEA